MLFFEKIVVTPFEQNARVIFDSDTGASVIVDPGGEANRIISVLTRLSIKTCSIFLTHSHIDHVGAVQSLLSWKPMKLHAHRMEEQFRRSVEEQAIYFGLSPQEYQNAPEPDVFLEDGDSFSVGGVQGTVLFTPGHSPGHVALFFEDLSECVIDGSEQRGRSVLIAGDVLFAGSIGRTDLPGASFQTLINSIHTKLFPLPDNTLVLPGHGPDTELGREKLTNPFLCG